MTPRTARLLRFGAIVAAMVLATTVMSWVGPVFVGLVFAGLDGRDSAATEAGLGAAIAWALAIAVSAVVAGARPLAVIGAALGVHVVVPAIVAVLFAAGLAWSSAALMLFVRRTVSGAGRRASGEEPAPHGAPLSRP